MRNIMIKIGKVFFMCLSFFCLTVDALPKTSIQHGTDAQGIPRVKMTNETNLTLACYVAIDGYKKKFVLNPFKSSIWFAATSNLYNHSHFSTWCDSLAFYPNYEKYRK